MPPPVSNAIASYSPSPRPTLSPVNVALFGDSIAHGSGATDIQLGWASLLQRHQSWNMTSFARGGTGFLSNVERPEAAYNSCRRDKCPNFTQMITEAAGVNPDLIIVSGGRIDSRLETKGRTAAIWEFFHSLESSFPDADIIATNVLWDHTDAPTSIDDMSVTIAEAVSSVGGLYFDIGQPLAGKPNLIAEDGTNPSSEGHELIYQLILQKLHSHGLSR